jgi:hypothetical protein
LSCNHPVASQVGEDASQHIQSLMNCPHAGVGSVVSGAILDHLACNGHLGKWICPVDLDVGVALVVFQAHVVARTMFLDQVHLQDQGFELRTDHDPVNIGDIFYELLRPEFSAAAMKVGANSAAQVDGLADVNDLASLVFHQVAACLGRSCIKDRLEMR